MCLEFVEGRGTARKEGVSFYKKSNFEKAGMFGGTLGRGCWCMM